MLVLESYHSLTENMHHHELQNILSGIISQEQGNLIQAVTQKLTGGKKAGSAFEKDSVAK